MESRMATLETRFDTILPTLATKEDVRHLETRFDTILPTLATKEDLKNLELKLTGTIHQEINACTWRMITWMTGVICISFAGVFFIARYIHV